MLEFRGWERYSAKDTKSIYRWKFEFLCPLETASLYVIMHILTKSSHKEKERFLLSHWDLQTHRSFSWYPAHVLCLAWFRIFLSDFTISKCFAIIYKSLFTKIFLGEKKIAYGYLAKDKVKSREGKKKEMLTTSFSSQLGFWHGSWLARTEMYIDTCSTGREGKKISPSGMGQNYPRLLHVLCFLKSDAFRWRNELH